MILLKETRKRSDKIGFETMLNQRMYEFVKYSPSEEVENLDCHVLVLIGSKDIFKLRAKKILKDIKNYYLKIENYKR